MAKKKQDIGTIVICMSDGYIVKHEQATRKLFESLIESIKSGSLFIKFVKGIEEHMLLISNIIDIRYTLDN